jgi:hypothetical protein
MNLPAVVKFVGMPLVFMNMVKTIKNQYKMVSENALKLQSEGSL